MLKTVSAGVTALFVTVSPLAYAQAPSPGVSERLSASDMGALTDARVKIIKAALDLTPDQEKYWPPVENAIRNRAQNRQARIENAAERSAEVRDRSPIEAVRDRNPIEFLHRRAAALAERAADLNKIADAWQPLYQTLSSDQKRRMGILAALVFHDMRNAVETRRLQAEEEAEADY